jgi:ferredoxin
MAVVIVRTGTHAPSRPYVPAGAGGADSVGWGGADGAADPGAEASGTEGGWAGVTRLSTTPPATDVLPGDFTALATLRRMSGIRVHVDAAACTGHGRCYALAPEVFAPDDAGHCELVAAEVPPDLEHQARLGAENCPEQAITVTAG